jgi:cytochrome c-type biogenesis protein CcmH
MKRLIKLSLILFALFSNNVYSNNEPIQFNDHKLEQRYQALIEETRCLVCQNQSLADSNADLAQDLRKEIYDMIVSGKSDEQVIQFLVERYGDFVLYRPPLKGNTWLLWFGPFLFAFIGLFAAIIIIKKQSGANNIDTEMNEEKKQRLAELLNEESNGSNK